MANFDTTSNRPSPLALTADALAVPGISVEGNEAKARRRRRRLGPGERIPYGQFLGPTLLILLWVGLSAGNVLDSRIVPAPWTVLETAERLWSSGRLPDDILSSLGRAVRGFGIGLTIGIALAIVSGLTRIGEALIDGPVQIKRGIPNLGLIPLFILWLGIGEEFKVAIIALGVFVPIYINTHAALSGIDNRYVELAESVRLSRWQFVRHVVIPGALPGFFIGLRLAVVGSWLSLIVIEQINATSGLGYMMFRAQNYGQTEVIFVGLLIYAVFGFVSNEVVRFTERKVLSWQRTLTS